MASSSCVVTETSRLATPERVIIELTRGRQIADSLRLLLRQTEFDGSVMPAQTLVTQLLNTFSNSLSMLRDSDEVSHTPPSLVKSEDSGYSCKTPAAKDRRGCYKRKRSSDTCVKETTNLFEDGHAWRKYGQKVILNAKHPRNYFRCTHKFDQSCPASKQVQKIEDDPPLYRTTYHGHHTCKNHLLKAPHHIIIDDATPQDSSTIWSFDGLRANSIKLEEDFQVKSVQLDRYLSPGFDDHMGAFSSGSDHGDGLSSDVYSCSASTHSVDDMVPIEEFFDFGTLN